VNWLVRLKGIDVAEITRWSTVTAPPAASWTAVAAHGRPSCARTSNVLGTPTSPDSVSVTGLPACAPGEATRLSDPWVTLTVVVVAMLGALSPLSSHTVIPKSAKPNSDRADRRVAAVQITETVSRIWRS
jgi:hypothetical protein